ncbi:hypothetical protein H0H93_004687 [Arthromyces matolae]|nr:hypothetical protein H0H93_004687 [Arthromyces matolae]
MVTNNPKKDIAHIKLDGKQSSELGAGSTGYVWKASSDIEGANVIALKQSRAPLRLKKPLIEYEACVLQFLQGHISIPKFYAYGRQKHFEFLALELLGSDLSTLCHGGSLSLSTVLKIATQMLSALSYIHGKGIAHRDIKPSNILLSLENPEQLKIVDFAFARRIDPNECRREIIADCGTGMVGTLSWASVRSHEGYQLTRRDDLESLAYVLLALIRGGLPWKAFHSVRIFNPKNQVLHKKRNWPGARLGAGQHPCFGEFLDYARNLRFDEIPDYRGWARTFNNLAKSCGFDKNRPFDWTIKKKKRRALDDQPPTSLAQTFPDLPVEKGQLLYAQILPRHTLEDMRPTLDSSYWHDPDLSTDPLLRHMNLIPGIVVHIAATTYMPTPYAYVLPIRRGRPPDLIKNLVTWIVSDSFPRIKDEYITLPDWPFDDTYCFGWPQPIPMVFLSEVVLSHWKISPQAAEKLYDTFKYSSIDRHSVDYEHLDRLSALPIFAQPYSLTPQTLKKCGDLTPNWTAEKGWFYDLERICMMIGKKNGIYWPWDPEEVEKEGIRFRMDSYQCFDAENWDDRQWESRDRSLTFPEPTGANLRQEIFKTQLVIEGLPDPNW